MIYIIHIGKCGGGSLKYELKKKNIKFIPCHVRKPEIKNDFKNIILIRDPINRFISAFNWKMFKSLDKETPSRHAKYVNATEIECYNYWKNVNNFAENLYDKDGIINNMALKLVNHSNHLKKDINYYLDEILPLCNTSNCDIIRYENYNNDIKKVFNLESITVRKNVPTKVYSKYISDKGIKNMKKFLEKDYNCFYKLREKNLISNEYYQNILSGVNNLNYL